MPFQSGLQTEAIAAIEGLNGTMHSLSCALQPEIVPLAMPPKPDRSGSDFSSEGTKSRTVFAKCRCT